MCIMDTMKHGSIRFLSPIDEFPYGPSAKLTQDSRLQWQWHLGIEM